VLGREGGEGKQVFCRVSQHVGGVVETPAQLAHDPAVLGPYAVVVGLLEDGAHQGGHHALGRFRHSGKDISAEMDVMPRSA
jgi:hypothetical protein